MNKNTVDIERIARLARLELDDSEKIRIQREIETFAEFAECLVGIDCEETEAGELEKCGFRADGAEPKEYTAQDLLGKKRVCDGYISVPLTVEEGV